MEIEAGIGFAGLCLAIAWYNVKKLEAVDPIDRIERLKALHEAGTIEDDEFQAVRTRLLKSLKK